MTLNCIRTVASVAVLLSSGYLSTSRASAFSTLAHSNRPFTKWSPHHPSPTSTQRNSLHASFSTLFDFRLTNTTMKQKSSDSFERIDDAIMGGISLSSLRDIPEQDYASWSGVCRTDGGGFCGVRTLPFKSPLNATNQNGVFIDCWLASDDEAERRMWKMTVRTDSSRGEKVHQAQFDLKRAMDGSNLNHTDGNTWARVMVPFDEFSMVRGPRLIPDGPPLDLSGGIYQIGMTMSKFKIAVNTTEIENFRPGYFDLRIQRMGFYSNDDNSNVGSSEELATLSKKEAGKRRPVMLKILVPAAKLFFSEKANRRKSAMKILMQKRNMSRVTAILLGIDIRKGSMGTFASMIETLKILGVDSFRLIVASALKIALVYPLRLVGRAIRTLRKAVGMKVEVSLNE